MYLLKLALRPWRMALGSQLFSALAIGVLLILSGFLGRIQTGLGPIIHRLAAEQVLTAYFDPSVSDAETRRVSGIVEDSIRLSKGAHAETHLVGTSQFVDELKVAYPDLGKELEALGPEMNSVIPRYISISGDLENGSLEKIKAISGIESVESSKDRYKNIVNAFQALRWLVRILFAGTVIALVTGLIHLSRMNGHLHEDTASLLRFWGANPLTTRAPQALSSGLTGLCGGLLALVGWLWLGRPLIERIGMISPLLRGLAGPSLTVGVTLLMAGTILGLLCGVLGEKT